MSDFRVRVQRRSSASSDENIKAMLLTYLLSFQRFNGVLSTMGA